MRMPQAKAGVSRCGPREGKSVVKLPFYSFRVLVLSLSFTTFLVGCDGSNRVYIRQGDPYFHTKGCPELGDTGEAYAHDAAVEAGYEPCPVCCGNSVYDAQEGEGHGDSSPGPWTVTRTFTCNMAPTSNSTFTISSDERYLYIELTFAAGTEPLGGAMRSFQMLDGQGNAIGSFYASRAEKQPLLIFDNSSWPKLETLRLSGLGHTAPLPAESPL